MADITLEIVIWMPAIAAALYLVLQTIRLIQHFRQRFKQRNKKQKARSKTLHPLPVMRDAIQTLAALIAICIGFAVWPYVEQTAPPYPGSAVILYV
jgi:hypothetical protein